MKKVMVLLAVLVLMLMTGCVRGEVESEQPMAESELAAALYEYKGTYIGDNSAVYAIADSLPFTGLTISSMALHTDTEPYGCTVNYYLGDRAAWHRDAQLFAETQLHLKQNSAVMLALIDNAEYVRISLLDEYGEFYWCNYYRDSLGETAGAEALTPAVIAAATDSEESFRDYLGAVISMPRQGTGANSRTHTIYSLLSDEEEIVTNSGLGGEFIYSADFNVPGYDIRALAAEYGIDPAAYEGCNIVVQVFQVNNYTDPAAGTRPYLSIFSGEELLYHQELTEAEEKQAVAFCAALAQISSNAF